jgi:hypothetical protein
LTENEEVLILPILFELNSVTHKRKSGAEREYYSIAERVCVVTGAGLRLEKRYLMGLGRLLDQLYYLQKRRNPSSQPILRSLHSLPKRPFQIPPRPGGFIDPDIFAKGKIRELRSKLRELSKFVAADRTRCKFYDKAGFLRLFEEFAGKSLKDWCGVQIEDNREVFKLVDVSDSTESGIEIVNNTQSSKSVEHKQMGE